MARLLLHIGMPKTGSSTLQRFLAHNAASLGVGYSFRAGAALIAFAADSDAAAAMPHLAPLQQFPLSVISNESLGSHVRREAQAVAIGRLLRGAFTEVRLVCYVRRQDEAVVSAYSTTLLSGSTSRFDPERIAWPWHVHQRLRLWLGAIGRERMIVRRFGAGYFTGGDLVADFAAATGLTLPGAAAEAPANVSPSAEALELMRLVNAELAGHPRRREVAKRILARAPAGRRLGLSAAARRALMARYDAANALLAREYFGTDELFTHPFADDAVAEVEPSPTEILALAAACGAAGLPARCGSVDAAVAAAARSLLAAGERRHDGDPP